MKPVVGANHRATKIEIVLPIDESGEYAFDEDGKPVKDRDPVVLIIPRFDCMTREQFKKLSKSLDEVGTLKDDDGEPLSVQERSYESVLRMLEPFVTAEELELVGGLRLFELEQIAELIQEASSMRVGELLASTNSSKSSAGRSKQTS